MHFILKNSFLISLACLFLAGCSNKKSKKIVTAGLDISTPITNMLYTVPEFDSCALSSTFGPQTLLTTSVMSPNKEKSEASKPKKAKKKNRVAPKIAQNEKKATKKEDKPKKSQFKKHVINFLEALKAENVAEAAKYSTSFGLETFLRFDIDRLSNYSVRDFKCDKKIGTAKVKIEGVKNEMLFYFNKRKGRWIFVGKD